MTPLRGPTSKPQSARHAEGGRIGQWILAVRTLDFWLVTTSSSSRTHARSRSSRRPKDVCLLKSALLERGQCFHSGTVNVVPSVLAHKVVVICIHVGSVDTVLPATIHFEKPAVPIASLGHEHSALTHSRRRHSILEKCLDIHHLESLIGSGLLNLSRLPLATAPAQDTA